MWAPSARLHYERIRLFSDWLRSGNKLTQGVQAGMAMNLWGYDNSELLLWNKCLSHSKRGQASTQYNNAGKHLERIKLRTTSSEACLPILLKNELNEVKKNSSRCQKSIWTVGHLQKRHLDTDAYLPIRIEVRS